MTKKKPDPKKKKKDDRSEQIGRYEIRRELGRGVMGVVYQAWDTALARTIALKTIKPVADSPEQREAWERRFLIEAQAAARLSHPAIVVVHDVGRDPDTDILYIALEYLEGRSLAQMSGPGRPLPWRDALRIIGQVAHGLHHAHTQGVIHRDIKPANVMVLPSGDAKILDFGVARLDDGSLTNPGDLCGTPLYMSPEQASGHTLDARSDIFSLGAVAWAILTGKSPFDAPTVSAILMRVMHKSPPPPSEMVRGIPKHVDEVLARSLAKNPEERYPDALRLAEDIEDALAGRIPRHRTEWTPITPGEQTRVAPRTPGEPLPALPVPEDPARARPARPRLRIAIGATILLGLAVGATLHFREHPENQRVWSTLLRRAVSSAPAQRVRARLQPVPAMASPAAAAATAWPKAPPPLGSAPVDILTPPPARGSGGLDAGAKAFTNGARAADNTPRAPSTPVLAPLAESPSPVVPSPAATPAPSTAAVRPSPSSTPRSSPKAYLSVAFEHRLKGGTLEVWVDGRRVLNERLDSRTTRKILLLEVRKGSVQRTLPLAPGRHTVKVRVRSDGTSKTAHTAARFAANATRRLQVSLARLSGKISLDWR